MPISFKDKNGKKHVFENHASFVSWLKKNRPDIKDPDAFAATIEKNQSKGSSKFSEHLSRIISKNMITGELMFDINSDVVVENVDIFLESIDVPIVTLNTQETDFGAKFDYVIDSRASVGNYVVIWNLLVSGQEVKEFDRFMISTDDIDRTLPLELQHLK